METSWGAAEILQKGGKKGMSWRGGEETQGTGEMDRRGCGTGLVIRCKGKGRDGSRLRVSDLGGQEDGGVIGRNKEGRGKSHVEEDNLCLCWSL